MLEKRTWNKIFSYLFFNTCARQREEALSAAVTGSRPIISFTQSETSLAQSFYTSNTNILFLISFFSKFSILQPIFPILLLLQIPTNSIIPNSLLSSFCFRTNHIPRIINFAVDFPTNPLDLISLWICQQLDSQSKINWM